MNGKSVCDELHYQFFFFHRAGLHEIKKCPLGTHQPAGENRGDKKLKEKKHRNTQRGKLMLTAVGLSWFTLGTIIAHVKPSIYNNNKSQRNHLYAFS